MDAIDDEALARVMLFAYERQEEARSSGSQQCWWRFFLMIKDPSS